MRKTRTNFIVLILSALLFLCAFMPFTTLSVFAEDYDALIPSFGLYCNNEEVNLRGSVNIDMTDDEQFEKGLAQMQSEYYASAGGQEVEFSLPFLARVMDMQNIKIYVDDQPVEGQIYYGDAHGFYYENIDVEEAIQDAYSTDFDETIKGTLYEVIPDAETITVMSSLAQDESRSISDNVTWGQRKRFADGKVNIPYKRFLGYKKGENDLPEIVPEQAEVVRLIYSLFLEGKTSYGIANYLTEKQIPTPTGKVIPWKSSTIESILQNEKYRGSALLQKKYTVDFLEKKMIVNDGKVPQYYVEDSHPAIITPAEFEIVQGEIQRRKANRGKYSCCAPFASKVVCGDCGEFYGQKVWHSNSKYRKIIYRCNGKYHGEKCATPSLTEEQLQQGFLKAINSLIGIKESLLEDCREMQAVLSDTTALDEELKTVTDEFMVVREMLRKMVEDNSRKVQDQDEFWAKYNPLDERAKKADARIQELMAQRTQRMQKAETIGAFMFELHEREEAVEAFDNKLWFMTVDKVVVQRDGKLVYHFRNGTEVEV